MNVVQRPRPREFCGTMQDYIIDTDGTITFEVQYGGIILQEEYVPDANYKVRIRGLGKLCELTLWGVWCAGENTTQESVAGTFRFLINGVEDAQSYVMFSRLATKKDAEFPGCLSEVFQKVTYPGAKEYVSGIPVLSNMNDTMSVTVYNDDGTTENKTIELAANQISAKRIYSFDASPNRICGMFSKPNLSKYQVNFSDGSMTFFINKNYYPNKWCFRFKNVYDMPETLTCTGGLTMAGANDSDVSFMYGIERKFSVKVTDEYTANSGVVLLQSDYKLWHNLVNSQEASILVDDDWLPILIIKQKFEREFRRSLLKTVEFTFRLADPEQNNLIEL